MIKKFKFQHPDLNSKELQLKQVELALYYKFPLIIKKYWVISVYIVLYIFFFSIVLVSFFFFLTSTYVKLHFLTHNHWYHDYIYEFDWYNFGCYVPKMVEFVDIDKIFTHYPISYNLGRFNNIGRPELEIIQNKLHWLFHGKWVFYSFHWEPFFFGVQNFKTLFAILSLNKNNIYSTLFLEKEYYFFNEWIKTPELNLNSFKDLIQKLSVHSHRNLRRKPHLLLNFFDNSYYPTDLELKYQFNKFLFHTLTYEFNSTPHLGVRHIDEIDNLHKALVQYKNTCFNNPKTIKNGKLIASDIFEQFKELEKIFDNYYYYRKRHENITSPEAQLLEYFFNVKFEEIKLLAKNNIVTTFNKNIDLLQDKVYPISSYNHTYEYIKIPRLGTKYILVQEQMINHFFW